VTKSALVILQARMSSSRLPGKVLKPINGTPMILWQIQRILKAGRVKNLVVATSCEESDDELVQILSQNKITVYRGSLEDVNSRFVATLELFPKEETIVRLTADCPLVMPELLDEMILEFNVNQDDYYSNAIHPTYPDGLDIEVFSRESFLILSSSDLSISEKEHVTKGYLNPSREFRTREKIREPDLSSYRWTVDFEEDYVFIKSVYEHFEGRELEFTERDVLNLLVNSGEIMEKMFKPSESRKDQR
jgi:spore coat polysaccharide biosynthesis protein SpsF